MYDVASCPVSSPKTTEQERCGRSQRWAEPAVGGALAPPTTEELQTEEQLLSPLCCIKDPLRPDRAPTLRRTEMMSGVTPSADWSSGSPATRGQRSSGFRMKLGAEAHWSASDESGLLRRPHRLDNASCLSLGSAYSPPPVYSLYGHPAPAPPPAFLRPSPPGWDLLSPSWSPAWSEPERRQCFGCGTHSALLWRREAAGTHLCSTCSVRQQNPPLLRPKRRAVRSRLLVTVETDPRGGGARASCWNCDKVLNRVRTDPVRSCCFIQTGGNSASSQQGALCSGVLSVPSLPASRRRPGKELSAPTAGREPRLCGGETLQETPSATPVASTTSCTRCIGHWH